MLPANTPALFGGKPKTYGIDQFTTSLMKFDGVYQAALAGNALTDYLKPARVWVTGGGAQASYPLKFSGTAAYVDGANLLSPDPNDPDYQVKPGQDFTFDFWWSPANTVAGTVLAKEAQPSGYCPWTLYQTGGTLYFYATSAGTAWDIANGQPVGGVAVGAWNHYGVQRRGNVWATLFNGGIGSTWTSAGNLMNSGLGRVCIGNNWPTSNQPTPGYIDELRFSTVARASETTGYARPTMPYYGTLKGGNDAATKLLLHFDGAWTDSAAGTALKTPHIFTPRGSAAFGVSGAEFKFGSSCAKFNGASASCLTTPFNTSTDLQTFDADWTVDFWYYRGATGAGQIIGARDTSAQFAGWVIGDDGVAAGTLRFLGSLNGSAWDYNVTIGNVPSNQWVHFALVRANALGTLKSYINGVEASSTAMTTRLNVYANNFSIGGLTDNTSVIGYLDEIRFSDVARWTANFAPPTAAY